MDKTNFTEKKTVALFVDHAAAVGGAEQSLLLLLAQLSGEQWQPHLACMPGKLAERAMNLGIPCHFISLPRLRHSWQFPKDWQKSACQLAKLAQDTHASAVYANTVRAAMVAAPAARFAKRPFFWHMRDFWLSENKPRHVWVDTAVKRLIGLSAVRVIACSRAVAKQLPCIGKTEVVHNGIQLDQFDPTMDGRPFRQQYHIPIDAPLVGMIGRLRPWKGQTQFLHMAALINRQHPETYFAIIGGANFDIQGDDYPQQLRQLTQALSLANRVIFTGMLTDVRPSLAAMDIFVHPGDPEPFGLVNIEAMAMARPVAAFRHGALPEIVEDGLTGSLVPTGDIPALAQAVAGLLFAPEKRSQMGVNGRIRAETCFAIQRTAQKISQILRTVISK
jgi:glycosyltransferase involved in cell wall biosynthesis